MTPRPVALSAALSVAVGTIDRMGWIGERVRDVGVRDAYAEVEDLASWSDWVPLADAAAGAPREPGVYLFREPATQRIVHAAVAGERSGTGVVPGLRGRLAGFRRPAGALGGFGEAALDRALADPAWVEDQLDRLRRDGPRRARDWAVDAVARLAPEVSWAVRSERADAVHLERRVLLVLAPCDLWVR